MTEQEGIESDILDLEFKKTLCIIREHIPYINSNRILDLCRLWLEKLSDGSTDKIQRNLYLIELANQIQRKRLLPPFHQVPPTEPLGEIWNNLHHLKARFFHSNKRSYLVDPSTKKSPMPFNDIEPLKSDDDLDNDDLYKENEFEPKMETDYREYRQKAGCGEPNTVSARDDTIYMEPHNAKEVIPNDDEDSWVDLTDNSSLGTGDADKEVPMEDSNIATNASGMKILTKKASKALGLSLHHLSTIDFKKSKTKWQQNKNFLSEDWKNTIEALQLRLSEMIHQNRELKSAIKHLERKIDEEAKQNEEGTNKKLKLENEKWTLEFEKLKGIHADNIYNLEKSFRSKLTEAEKDHNQRLEKNCESYEKRIAEVKIENGKTVKKKEEEISNLTEIIQQQCIRIAGEISTLHNQISNCTCEEKIALLRKCVSKMDKLFQRSQKEHAKQIEKLKQEMEIREGALQIQLKVQKAELLSQSSTERQEEFDKILNSLEVKYIKMLELYEVQIMDMKKQDEERITTLKELLIQHSIPFDDVDV